MAQNEDAELELMQTQIGRYTDANMGRRFKYQRACVPDLRTGVGWLVHERPAVLLLYFGRENWAPQLDYALAVPGHQEVLKFWRPWH